MANHVDGKFTAVLVGIPALGFLFCALFVFLHRSPQVRRGASIAAIILGVAGLLFGVYALSSLNQTDIDRVAMMEASNHELRGMTRAVQGMRSKIHIGMLLCAGLLPAGFGGLVRRSQAASGSGSEGQSESLGAHFISPDSAISRLRTLGELREKGLVTDAEYEEKKVEILQQM